mmetsp:Transcript_19880/g.24275  ORF Transcript_19880/g.24275 Transcript_19880/m.24275 type:complete len:95 (+) Transcript_19880:1674-1958(+)
MLSTGPRLREIADTIRVTFRIYSGENPFLMQIEKHCEPAMEQSIKVEKINPKGGVELRSRLLTAGVHIKTKEYIAPSKHACVIPTHKIRESEKV